ncbi:MAG: hypothetical protein SGPRY_008608, partial [Prymnesium sp.]
MADGSYEPPSLQPLVITPQMVAQARASEQAEHPSPPPSSQVEQLKVPACDRFHRALAPTSHAVRASLQSMFPEFDSDVLSSVLSTSGNMENAVSQLLEMNGGFVNRLTDVNSLEPAIPFLTPAASGPTSASGMDMDEELAAALFQSFAGTIVGYTSDLEEQPPSVPTDVKASASA